VDAGRDLTEVALWHMHIVVEDMLHRKHVDFHLKVSLANTVVQRAIKNEMRNHRRMNSRTWYTSVTIKWFFSKCEWSGFGHLSAERYHDGQFKYNEITLWENELYKKNYVYDFRVISEN